MPLARSIREPQTAGHLVQPASGGCDRRWQPAPDRRPSPRCHLPALRAARRDLILGGRVESAAFWHPQFSPSGRSVIYTSDSGGSAQVYLVPLAR